MSVALELDGWVDGARVVATVHPPPLDRWQLHAADEARVTIRGGDGNDDDGAVCVRLRQRPSAIPASRMGVGAVLWEGELALAAFLASQPRHRWPGASVVELGAGPGLAGLVAAALGARRVVITDLEKVLPLIRENAALNGYGGGGEQAATTTAGAAAVVAAALEWGKEGYLREAAAVARLANGGREGGGLGGSSGGGGGGGGGDRPSSKKKEKDGGGGGGGGGGNAGGVDWVIAADVTYVDGDGASPSTRHFVRACHALSGARTRVVVALEVRAGCVRDELRRHGARLFERSRRLRGGALPRGYCREVGDHLEVYEFGGPRDLREVSEASEEEEEEEEAAEGEGRR